MVFTDLLWSQTPTPAWLKLLALGYLDSSKPRKMGGLCDLSRQETDILLGNQRSENQL